LLVAAVSERVLVIYSAMLVRADDAKVHRRRRRYSMPQLRRPRRGPKPDRRRALELLAASPDGCTERVVAGNRTIEVARVRITDAGRQRLGE
jgi:hypothetical protein